MGASHTDTAFSLNNLAEIYRATGRYVSADRLFREAIQIIESSHGRDDPYLARVLNNLAAVRANLDRSDSAVQLYQRALHILEKAGERDAPTVAGILNNIAVCLINQNEHRRAEPLLVRSIRAHETQIALESYAIVLRKMKRTDEARLIEKRIRKLRAAAAQ